MPTLSVSDKQLDLLLRGLVGDEYQQLFDTDAQFHASVYALVRMLPLWVDGLAAEARPNGITRQQEYERLAGMSVPLFPSRGPLTDKELR